MNFNRRGEVALQIAGVRGSLRLRASARIDATWKLRRTVRGRESSRDAIDGDAFVAHGERQSATAEFFWSAEMEGIPWRRAVLEFWEVAAFDIGCNPYAGGGLRNLCRKPRIRCGRAAEARLEPPNLCGGGALQRSEKASHL